MKFLQRKYPKEKQIHFFEIAICNYFKIKYPDTMVLKDFAVYIDEVVVAVDFVFLATTVTEEEEQWKPISSPLSGISPRYRGLPVESPYLTWFLIVKINLFSFVSGLILLTIIGKMERESQMK